MAIDLRGHGRSEVTGAGTYGWCNHARDVLGIADAVGAPSFAVIGQTSGAAIAMTCAQLEPSRIAAQSPGQSGYPQRYVVRDAQVRIRVGMNWKSSMLALRSAICWTDSGVASCSASITIQA